MSPGVIEDSIIALVPNEDKTEWTLITDQHKIVEAHGALVGINEDSLVLKLHKKYPSHLQGMTRVRSHLWGGHIDILSDPFYSGTNEAEARELAKRHGVHIPCPNLHFSRECSGCLKIDGGFVYDKRGVSYDPKRAKRILKRRKSPKGTPIRKYEFQGLNYDISRNIPHFFSDYDAGYYLHQSMRNLGWTIGIFNYLFGKNAHRRLECFQHFKEEWKSRYKGCQRLHKEHEKFVVWMNIESKKQRPRKMGVVPINIKSVLDE